MELKPFQHHVEPHDCPTNDFGSDASTGSPVHGKALPMVLATEFGSLPRDGLPEVPPKAGDVAQEGVHGQGLRAGRPDDRAESLNVKKA